MNHVGEWIWRTMITAQSGFQALRDILRQFRYQALHFETQTLSLPLKNKKNGNPPSAMSRASRGPAPAKKEPDSGDPSRGSRLADAQSVQLASVPYAA